MACSGSAAPPLDDRHVSHREAQMVTRTLVSAVVASLFIAGCASMKPTDFSPRPSAKECNGSGNCTVSVSVVDLSIKVDPEFVIFNNRRGSSIKIKWEIQTAGYAIDSIEIPDGGGDFAECGPEGNHFSCKNLHKTFGVFKYTVKVRGQPPVPPKDPWMVND
jgi:hypothetical protein